MFKDGRWNKEINVADFVHENITPYEGDASFLVGPTERTKKIWDKCLEALAEELSKREDYSAEIAQMQQRLEKIDKKLGVNNP